tara:strand:- start:11040 stop:11336 length:297 start_codon:yes stop_codon:yes gene_type:complete
MEKTTKRFNVAKKEWGAGVDYREIAKKISTITNEPITFTGVRSIFLRAMKTIASEYISEYRPEIVGIKRKEFAEELAKTTEFQNAVGEYLHKLNIMYK